ncbi:MAG: glycosyltransferase family 2 protein [Flectobacillus sp.]|uniref:glycosyltransferase family 2 protein n=1 Tax=Flectobacillus sp. TaxID=50419 RepID=UPI003B9B88B1
MHKDISVIILTFNEEKHIARCIKSILPFTNKIFIVDSGSTDKTVEIAEKLGAVVKYNPWVNYAQQFNFGIENIPFQTKWLMRMDSDEYIMPELAEEISTKLEMLEKDVSGIYVKRRVMFFNKWIKHGAYYPIWLLRIWQRGKGVCEETWMDEHIKITEGITQNFEHDIVDHNLNNLTWWTQKHNLYAIREVIDLLNMKYDFRDFESVEPRLFGSQEQRKRFLKMKYASLPLFTRPFMYFVYRYFIRLGFLDGTKGLVWHFLQGFWYRFLVDAKIYEVYQRVGKEKNAIIDFFQKEYNKNLRI